MTLNLVTFDIKLNKNIPEFEAIGLEPGLPVQCATFVLLIHTK